MAGYGGYGLQALTQGFQSGFSMATQARQLKEQRLEKEELKKKKDALALVVGNIEGKASEYSKGGWSNQEVGDFSALIHGSGVEIQGYFKGYLESIESGNKERRDEYKSLIDEFTKGLDDLDLSDIQKAVDAFSPNIKSEDGKKYLDVNTNMKRSLAQKQKNQTKIYTSNKEAEAANPGMEIKFYPSLNGFVAVNKRADTTLYPTQESAMANAMKIEGFTPIPVQVEGGFKIQQQKKTSPGDVGSGYRSTSVSMQKDLEENMLEAETIEEKHKLENDYLTAKDTQNRSYDPNSVKVSDEKWTEVKTKERTAKVENTITKLEGLLNEEGTFNPEEMTTLPIGGEDWEQTKMEWYIDLYKQYQEEIKRLTELGVDTSQYKKPISPEKLKKIQSFWNPGIEARGDVKGIWDISEKEFQP